MNYRVEYENEGRGVAYGVYFTDTLDKNLDESTLSIGVVRDVSTGAQIGGRHYNTATRTITWFAGETQPGAGGFAEYSVHLKSGLAEGTQVVNYATAYFPSVPEATVTNSVVSYIPYLSAFTASEGEQFSHPACLTPHREAGRRSP